MQAAIFGIESAEKFLSTLLTYAISSVTEFLIDAGYHTDLIHYLQKQYSL